ncbi:hypothetical protein Tsubulata_044816 [Turnera subulata]|uniref:F-box domain-containing protein n=1 Tax=Turnera subulata TaxID=218843 RepID=A0A9Q0FK53_9ROSI|nr:hypothetical protein Tsubulata_044816 [Turnera subulata]
MAITPAKLPSSDSEEDIISKLPDEILASIISLLSMKDATKTSVLSSRWRNLWTATRRLEFDDKMLVTKDEYSRICRKSKEELGFGKVVVVVGDEIGLLLELDRRIAETKQHRFISRVNHILNSHEGSPIQEFKLCCSSEVHFLHQSHIDSWIKFALEKRVEKLFLNLLGTRYTLTPSLLCSYNLGSIKDLSLTSLDLTSEVMEYILSNCPSLEVLNVKSSLTLVRLQVSGPLLKQCLITDCSNLQSVEISAPNLVKFEFCRFLSRLEILTLDLRAQSIRNFTGFPKLRNLKKVELKLKGCGVSNLRHCAILLDMIPLLQIFIVEISGLEVLEVDRDVRELEGKPHQCLRLLQMRDFVGCTIDFELALCLLKRAVLLEKFVIYASQDEKKRTSAATRRKQLQKYLPPGAEFLML